MFGLSFKSKALCHETAGGAHKEVNSRLLLCLILDLHSNLAGIRSWVMMEVENNMPPDKNRSSYADGVSFGRTYSTENGGGSRNAFFSLGRFANTLKLAVALWCKWYLRGRGEQLWDRSKNMQSLE